MKTFLFSLFSLSILSASCTKEVKYSKEALLALAQKADPTVTAVLPKTMATGISCSDYSTGCLSAHIVRVKGLELIAVEYMSREDAIASAKKFRGYYIRNWMLDDVTGEPILEGFVVKELKAQKP